MSFANGRNFRTPLRLIVFGVGSGESAKRRLDLSPTGAGKSSMKLLQLREADLFAPINFPVGVGQFDLCGWIFSRGQMTQIGGKKKPFFG